MSDISSGQTSSRTTSCGIAYSEAEERTVERINAVSQRVHDAQREIGKIVDDIVAVKGGPVYGDRTLDRLSKHPKLECSREHLRRCWQFYRLVKHYGEELKAVAPALKCSHSYQISRLLDIEDEQVRRDAILAMAKKATDEHLTVTATADAVSTHLKSLGRTTRDRPTRKSTGNGTQGGSEDDAYDALIETSETVVTAMMNIADKTEVGRVADLKRAANRLGFSYVQLVAKLIASGDEDAALDARKVGDALAAAIESVVSAARNEGGLQNDAK